MYTIIFSLMSKIWMYSLDNVRSNSIEMIVGGRLLYNINIEIFIEY